MTNNDDTSNVEEAMKILDVDVANHGRASEMFYGFRWHGAGFTIEGYVGFGVEMSENEVQDILPGFEVRRFAFVNQAYLSHDELHCNCIFTIHGVAWNHDYIELFAGNHDNDLDEDHIEDA